MESATLINHDLGHAFRTAFLRAVAGILPVHLTHGRVFRTAGIPAGAFSYSCVITHLPAAAEAPRGDSLFTSHKSPVTSHDLLIYGSAIRNPRNS
jgi:hypothetical protein